MSREADAGSVERGLFRQEGDYWTVGYGERVFRLKDCLGLSFISYLLHHPGTEFHVLDLGERAPDRELARDQAKQSSGSLPMNPEELEASGIHVGGLGDAGELLDEQAKAAYKARLGELREELEEAKEFGQVERAARAEEEIGALGAELSRGIGLGGRHRRAASATERARQRAKKNIKTAIGRIPDTTPSWDEGSPAASGPGSIAPTFPTLGFKLRGSLRRKHPRQQHHQWSQEVQRLLQVKDCTWRRRRSKLM
jgi:hypothetical protein